MDTIDTDLWRWSAILLLAGGILFWVGAFTPPYRQWMTHDIREYLGIIAANRINWYVIHFFFLFGVVVTLIGVALIAKVIDRSGQVLLSQVALTAFSVGAVFWLIDIAFRVTVTVGAANKLLNDSMIVEGYEALKMWSGLLFAFYMVLAYFTIGCIGYSSLNIGFIPTWLAWFNIIFGFSGALFFATGFPLFAPPLMVHLPLMVTGVTVLLKLKGG